MNEFPKPNIPDRLSSNRSSMLRSPNPFLLKSTYLYSPGKKQKSPYELSDDHFFLEDGPSVLQYSGTQPSSPRLSNSKANRDHHLPDRKSFSSYRSSKSSDSDDNSYNDFYISRPRPPPLPPQYSGNQSSESSKINSKHRSTTAFAINITSYGTPVRSGQNHHNESKRLLDIDSLSDQVTHSCPGKSNYNQNFPRGRRNIVKFTFDSDSTSTSSSGNKSDHSSLYSHHFPPY